MASSSTSELHGAHIETLKGQGNYVRWLRDLKPVAESKNLWSLLSGEEEALERPERPVKPQSATIPLRITRSQTKKAAAAATGAETPDDSKEGVTLPTLSSEAYKEAVEDFKLAIVDYRLDLEQYEKQDARVRQAKGLLAMSVDPAIRSIIADISGPHEAFLEIKSICQMTDARALGLALSKIDQIKFTKNDTVASFLNHVLLLQSDINDLKGSYTDDQVIAKVLRSLPSTFAPFINHWNMLAGTLSLPNTVKELYSQLLSAEAQLPQTQKTPRSKDDRPQNGRNADKPGNRLLPCCNKYGTHKEDECWTLHPELRKSSNGDKSPPKPRANVVTESETQDKKEKEKDKSKDKDKEKKPTKVTANAVIGDRERFEAICSEAFQVDAELQLQLTLAINTPLPSSDDEDIDLAHIQVPGAYPDDTSPVSDPGDAPVTTDDVWQTAMHQEMDSMGPVPTWKRNMWLFSVEQLRRIQTPDTFHSTATTLSIEQAPRALIDALTEHLEASIESSIPSLTMSDEPAISEAMEEFDDHHHDLHAQEQLHQELRKSTVGEATCHQGTPPQSSPLELVADSSNQTTLCGSKTLLVFCSIEEYVWNQTRGEKGRKLAGMVLHQSDDLQGNTWIADSGASLCITNDKAWFKDFRVFSFPMGTAASDEELRIEGGGVVVLHLDIGDGQPVQLELHNVAYAPDARCNILSLSQVADKAGLRGHWSKDEITILTKHGIQIGIAPLVDGLYHVQLAPHSYPVLPPRAMLTHRNTETAEGGASSEDGSSGEQPQDDETDTGEGGASEEDEDEPPSESVEGGVSEEDEDEPRADSVEGGDSGNEIQPPSEDEDPASSINNSTTEDESEDEETVHMPPETIPPFAVPEIDYDDPVWVWHRRLGHLGFDNMMKLLKMSDGIDLTEKQIKSKAGMICPVCATTKAVNRVPRDPATRRGKRLGELLHVDTWGPYPVKGHDGSLYQLAIIDDATRFTWTARFAAKHQLPAVFKKLHKRIERKHDITIATYRMDNELPSYGKIKRYVEKHGITLEVAIAYRHHMNGAIERGFRTERERASAMIRETQLAGRITDILGNRTHEALLHTSIPEEFWCEAFEQAVRLKNRAPTRALKNKITPWEAVYDIKPDLSKEKIFGSRLYLAIPSEHRRKSLLIPRGRMLYFIGCESESVMIAYNSDTHAVERITAARVEDGVGTQDPHGSQSLAQREQQEQHDSVSLDDASQKSNEGHLSLSEDEESLPYQSQNRREASIELGDNTSHKESSDEANNTESSHRHINPSAMSLSRLSVSIHSDSEDCRSTVLSPVMSHHSGDENATEEDHAREFSFDGPAHPSAQVVRYDDEEFSDQDSSDDTEAPVVRSKYFKHRTRPDTKDKKGRFKKGVSQDHGPKSVNRLGQSLTWKSTDTLTAMDVIKELHPGNLPLRAAIFKELFPDLGLSTAQITTYTKQIHSKMLRHTYTKPWPLIEDDDTRSAMRERIENTAAHKDPDRPERPNKKHKNASRFQYSLEEDICIAVLKESNKYSCRAAHLIYLDIFAFNYSTEAPHPFKAFKKKWKLITKAKYSLNDATIRQQMTEAIQNSSALAAFEPDSTGPTKRLSHHRCIGCSWSSLGSLTCNEKPCKKCINSNRPCTIRIDEHITISYWTDDARPEWAEEPMEEVECCYTCNERSRALIGRNVAGHGEFPCEPCLELSKTDSYRRCRRPLPDGGVLIWMRTVRKKPNRSTKNKNDNEIPDSDDDGADMLTSSSSEDESDDPGSLDRDLDEDAPNTGKRKAPSRRTGDSRPPRYRYNSSSNDDSDDDEQSVVPSSRQRVSKPLATTSSNKPTNTSKSTKSTKPASGRRPRTDMCCLLKINMSMEPDPNTRKQAMAQRDAEKWKVAMDEEYDSLMLNNTWNVVPRPQDRKVLSSRWVYKRKLGPDGTVAKYKARFVVRGFTQVQGLDYDETYSSVVRAPSYRLLFALQVRYGWYCHQMDVKTAFLHGDIEHDIYVEAPEGYPEAENKVLHLNKALYGLKQSPRQWGAKLRNFLESNGWVTSDYDHSIFIYQRGNSPLIIDVYVDDIKIFAANYEDVVLTKNMLHSRFEMTDLGPCSYYLGMHVDQGRDGSVHLHQSSYIHQILERYELSNVYPRHTPMRKECKLVKNTGPAKPKAFQKLYQSKVGSLLYLACVARPDLAEAVGIVSRYNADPNDIHMAAVDDIFGYIKATPNLGLHYKKEGNTDLHAYSDSDLAGCKDTSRSTTGWLVMLSGAPISWSSKRQKTVALSVCEAEYVAAYKAAQELVWTQNLLEELGATDVQTKGTLLLMDNESAIKLTRNPEFHDRTKHIAIKRHYLRELNLRGQITTKWVPTADNLADMFTKPLSRDLFEKFVQRIGLTKATCSR
ncbi:hypothetical protein KCU67_g4321, partial [Aureobasidium melanogenum]